MVTTKKKIYKHRQSNMRKESKHATTKKINEKQKKAVREERKSKAGTRHTGNN